MGDPVSLRINEQLALAKDLVACLEAGREADALNLIARLAGFKVNILFHEVGRLTRELHDAIKSFMIDSRLANIAETQMPDAAERLTYVIDMTEKAANTTLTAVEDAMPLAETLKADSGRLAASWEHFNARQMDVHDYRGMSRELEAFLHDTQANAAALNDKLSEVLMAQGYQDLTGQVIGRVIALVQDVEAKLVELVRLSGIPQGAGDSVQPDSDTANTRAQGPIVPGVDIVDAVQGQDEVDDLLSSLGF